MPSCAPCAANSTCPTRRANTHDLAEQEAREASDYYQFTSIINRRFSHPQKIHVVELLWEIAYAEAAANPYEEHLIRKLADLLYVDHRDYITAKLKARNRGAHT